MGCGKFLFRVESHVFAKAKTRRRVGKHAWVFSYFYSNVQERAWVNLEDKKKKNKQKIEKQSEGKNKG